jgi:hypothetical protein
MAIEASRTLDTNELAETLQALLGKEVLVVTSLNDPAFCMSFQARVMGIEASPETPMMTLHFGASESLTVPCEETISSSGSSERHGHKTHWVELQLLKGPTVMIEEISACS